MSKKTAGLVLTGVFVMPHADAYEEYIDYMGRSEAVRNENFNKFNAFEDSSGSNIIDGAGESQFERYTDYMSNPEKTKSLFNLRYDRMPIEDVHYTKNYFLDGQTNGSPLWQLVFSFRNEWLEEHGLMNQATHEVNETKIYDATRSAMKQLVDKEKLNAEWLGSIHFNTKHIHVHVGMVERNPTREYIYYEDKKNPENTGWQYKGKLKINHINGAKSKFVNNLLDMQQELTMVDEKMKHFVTNAKKNLPELKQELFQKALHDLEMKLPKNKSRWVYGYAKGQKFKPEIDRVITMYLNTYAKDDLQAFISRVKPISDQYEEAYGNPKNEPTYLDNKLYGKNGLYHTVGNVLLKELKELNRQKSANHSKERLTLDDLKELKKEESCVRSDLPNADDLFESSEDEEYQYYMDELVASEEPILVEDFNSDELYQELTYYEEQALVEPVMSDAITRLKEELLARTPSQEQINEKLYALNEEEKRTVEKRGVVIHDNGSFEPVKLVEHTTLKGYLAVPSSNQDVLAVGQGKKEKVGDEKQHNISSFSKKNRIAILEQDPNATFIYGERQWRLAGREIIEAERKRPIMISAPIFEGELTNKQLVGFTLIPMFDVAQTKKIDKEKVVYANQEGVKIEKNSFVKRGQSSNHYSHSDAIDRQFKKMMNKLENTTQKYLNEKAFREMEYQQSR